jgi:hypothetical protein
VSSTNVTIHRCRSGWSACVGASRGGDAWEITRGYFRTLPELDAVIVRCIDAAETASLPMGELREAWRAAVGGCAS